QKDLLYLTETDEKQIPRFARDDMIGGFYTSQSTRQSGACQYVLPWDLEHEASIESTPAYTPSTGGNGCHYRCGRGSRSWLRQGASQQARGHRSPHGDKRAWPALG